MAIPAGLLGGPAELGDRRFVHPGPLRWLRAIAWMLLLFVLVSMAGYMPIAFLGPVANDSNGPGQFLVECAGALCAVGVYVLMVWLAEGRLPSELAWRPALPGVAAGLLIGLAVFSSVMVVLIGTGLYEHHWTGFGSPWRGLGLSVESGVIEEVLARGVLLRLMWRALGPWVAFAFSAALFGLGHLANPNASWFAAICIALEAGILLGAFYALTGRLWVSIGLHAGWNFSQGYIFGAAVSGTDFGPAIARSVATSGHPSWLTGAQFGPEASLPALVICTAVGLGVIGWAWKLGRFARPGPAPEAAETFS